jgi:hypothetical protein
MATAEYMREYRKKGDTSLKAQHMARERAVQWVRTEYPAKWDEILTESRKELGLSTERTASGRFRSTKRDAPPEEE